MRQCRTHPAEHPSSLFRDVTYRTKKSWSRSRRGVAKVGHLEKGANPRFVVTSIPAGEFDARTLYEQEYCARGEMENRIKEQQLYLFADRVSATTMRANQLRLYEAAAAYLLIHAFRRLGLADTPLAQAQTPTIRQRAKTALVQHLARRLHVPAYKTPAMRGVDHPSRPPPNSE